MITSVNTQNSNYCRALVSDMYRLRALVFGERLKWDVHIENGMEIDEYDHCDPHYLVYTQDNPTKALGCARLLPTTGRHMMRDVFIKYFNEDVLFESPLIWECTRFCHHPHADSKGHAVNVITIELLIGICELALDAGVAQITGVFDRRMIPIYRRAGWTPDIVASSDKAGPHTIYVGLWDVTENALVTMRRYLGITHSVFETPPSSAAVA